MRTCTGNDTREWGWDAIFDVACPHCGAAVEFFKDEIRRTCPRCRTAVSNDRRDYGCGQWCSAASPHTRNYCSRFKRSKDRFYGHKIA